MNKQKEKLDNFLKKYRQEWLSFGIVLLLMIVYTAVLQRFPFQKYFCSGDTQGQILPISTLMADKLKEGSPFFYSDYLGMGGNTTVSFWFHAMGPLFPFYLIMDAAWAACICLILRPALAAFFFAGFCKSCLKRDGIETIIFSVAYSLCGYTFAYRDSMMLDALYFLPLVLILVERCVVKKKALALCLAYTVLFLSNFYVTFLVGLTSFVYLLVIHLICNRYQLTAGEKRKIFLHYVYAAGTALCISMIFVLPACFYEFSVQSAIEGDFSYNVPKIWDVISSVMFGAKYEMGVHIPYLYCGILTVLLCPFYFINPHIKKKEKVLAGASLFFLAMCMFIPFLYRLAHMLNFPNGLTMRFSYVFIFILSSMAVRQWKHLESIKTDWIILWSVILLIIYIFTPVLNRETGDVLKQGVSIACMVGYILLLKQYYLAKAGGHTKKERLLCGILLTAVIIEATSNGIVLNDVGNTNDNTYVNIEKANEMLSKEKEAPYRTQIIGGALKNYPMLSHFYGMDLYSSGINFREAEVLRRLGLITNNADILSFGLNRATRMLFGVKYRVNLMREAPVLEEQDETLPFGYMIAGEPDRLEDKDAIINVNRTVSAFTGEEADLFEIYDGDILFENSGVELLTDKDNRIVLKRDEKVRGTAWVRFEIPLKDSDGAYVYWNTDFGVWNFETPYMNVENEMELSSFYKGSLSQERIYKLEETPEGHYVYILMDEGGMEQFVLNRIQFAYLNEEEFQKTYENLSMSVMNISEFCDGYIKGSVTATDEKRLLFVSVPYEPGWSVYSDGEEIPCISLLDGAFLGTELAPGEHTVEFVYHAPGSDFGRYISILGCVLLLLYILYLAMPYILLQNDKNKI